MQTTGSTNVPPGTPETPRPFENANQYAASLGGPFRKNRSFFFVDYEGIHLDLPIYYGTLTLIPSPQFEKATLGNLSSTRQSASIPFYQQMFTLWNSVPGPSGLSPATHRPGTPPGAMGGLVL